MNLSDDKENDIDDLHVPIKSMRDRLFKIHKDVAKFSKESSRASDK